MALPIAQTKFPVHVAEFDEALRIESIVDSSVDLFPPGASSSPCFALSTTSHIESSRLTFAGSSRCAIVRRRQPLAAVRAIWDRYFPRVVGLAASRLGGQPRQVVDEEDVAINVMESFFRAARSVSGSA